MSSRSKGSGSKDGVGVDTDLGTDSRTDPMAEDDPTNVTGTTGHTGHTGDYVDLTDETDGGFTTIEGLVGFVPDWDNDETTDFGRTGMRVPDSQQQTRLHGRAFDAMRDGDSSKSSPPVIQQVIIEEDDGSGGTVLVAGVGVLAAMVGTALALFAILLLLLWFGFRTPTTVVVIEEPSAPADGGAGIGEPPTAEQPGVGEPGGDDPASDPPPPAPTPGTPAPPVRPILDPGGDPTVPLTRFPATFKFNQWDPRNVDRKALVNLVDQLKACSNVIVLTGHTDGVGSEGVNERFAIARAAAVRDLIAERGISKQKMVLGSAFDERDVGGVGRRVDVMCP